MLFQPIVLVQSQPETIGVGQDNTTKARNNHKEGNGYYHQKDCVNEHKKRKTRIVKENDKGFTIFEGKGSKDNVNMILIIVSRKESKKMLKKLRRK